MRCAFVCGLRLYQPLGALPAVRAAAVHSMLHDETSVVSAWVWWRGRLWMNKRGPLFILITLPHTNHHSLVIVFMFELAMLSYAMSLFCCCYGYCGTCDPHHASFEHLRCSRSYSLLRYKQENGCKQPELHRCALWLLAFALRHKEPLFFWCSPQPMHRSKASTRRVQAVQDTIAYRCALLGREPEATLNSRRVKLLCFIVCGSLFHFAF